MVVPVAHNSTTPRTPRTTPQEPSRRPSIRQDLDAFLLSVLPTPKESVQRRCTKNLDVTPKREKRRKREGYVHRNVHTSSNKKTNPSLEQKARLRELAKGALKQSTDGTHRSLTRPVSQATTGKERMILRAETNCWITQVTEFIISLRMWWSLAVCDDRSSRGSVWGAREGARPPNYHQASVTGQAGKAGRA